MDLNKVYGVRPNFSHKGNYGSVMVICGSKLYSGSATLVAVSALRAGSDLVTVIAPARACEVASYTLPDLICYPLKGDYLTNRHIDEIVEIAHVRKINSVVMGCGLGRHPTTLLSIQKLISKFVIPMVLDADALRAIALKPEVILGKQVVLTPHLGELAVLLGQNYVEEDFDVRMISSKQAAEKYKAVVLLKGYVDIITDGATSITNNSGSPFMTKGGFGDTLAGVLGALLARSIGLIEAAHVAAYINGKAGELASEDLGESVVASDIFEYLPKVINAR